MPIVLCQNCKKDFAIEPDDLLFYEKVKVPPPTFCPACRMQRRMSFRNQRSLYKANCDRCNKSIFSMYSGDMPFIVYCDECWYGDVWDAKDYAMEYDFSRPFFEQFRELQAKVPRIAVEGYQNQDSPFTNLTWFSKNIYLAFSTMYAENIAYSFGALYSRDIFDSFIANRSALGYELLYVDSCSMSQYLENCRECIECLFLYDSINCHDCFMSANLRNKSYVFRNEQLTKEEYALRMREIKTGNFQTAAELKKEFLEVRKNAIHRYAFTLKSDNVSGNNILAAKNVHHSFDIFSGENLKYCAEVNGVKDSMDLYGAGDGGTLAYEGMNVGYKDASVILSTNTYEEIHGAAYCDYCRGGANLFGCVGMRKQKYCILNKEYTKEEYEALVPKIIRHMHDMPYVDAKGRTYAYGEFFPIEFSPFAYNESIAYQEYPLSEAEMLDSGYRYKKPDDKDHGITKNHADLPLSIEEIPDAVVKEVIACDHGGKCVEQCTGAFRISPDELAFYRRMHIPVPDLCPNCRYYARLRLKLPMRLWDRSCMCSIDAHGHAGICPNRFETPYEPGRPETVYCESCYQKEVV